MTRLILWLVPLDTCVPSTKMELVSMLKAVMFEAALIKTLPIAVLLGTAVDANSRVALVMIDPLLNESTFIKRNDENSW